MRSSPPARMKRSNTDPLAGRLGRARSELAAGIEARRTPSTLLTAYSRAVDDIIRAAWRAAAPSGGTALLATGGYGRRELYPGSDIDLAILLEEAPSAEMQARLEGFVQRLWDLGLKPGTSVRTMPETEQAAAGDVTTFTALCEARLLAGNRRLAAELEHLLAEPGLWPAADYLAAKRAEREDRYARYDNSSHRLEPSVKESPGGLRDLMTLTWVSARHLGKRSVKLRDLQHAGLITAGEHRALVRAARTLAGIRLGLHHLAGRPEDRLLFDLQPRLAELLHYHARPGILAVERMMQDYYRAATTVAQVNALLFQALGTTPAPAHPLSPGLVARGEQIDFESPALLRAQPQLLLEIFRRWQEQPRLADISPDAKRAITAAVGAIDAHFRADPRNRALFLSILTAMKRVADALWAMHDTGVLNRYLPAFARITGRMQYDLFHVFTVDEHVLRVLRNAEDLRQGRFSAARPDLLEAAKRLDRPEILYIAALFHDIAKGRGGDHAVLGARDARRFATEHGLHKADAELCAWLVRHHLTLSTTAQKADLSDPRVVADFARLIVDQRRLDYLYVLTAADVRATNPALWNAWRGTLFGELYQAASRALWRGLEHPVDAAAEIGARKRDARRLLGGGNAAVTRLWKTLGDSYFLQYNAEEIAWHTRALLGAAGPPAVFLRPAPDGAGTAIAVYCSRHIFAFGRVTAALAQLGLTIVAARCVPVGSAETLDTYVVVEADGTPVDDRRQLTRMETLLAEELHHDTPEPRRVTRPTPRQVRLFPTPTRIDYSTDPDGRHTVLELHASDRPGLLAAVGRAFRRCSVYLRTARIMTVGERAEDVFHVTDSENRPLGPPACEQLASVMQEEIAAEG